MMRIFKKLICILMLPLLLAGCTRQASYEQTQQLYQSLTASFASMTEEECYAAYAEIFDNIAHGSPSEQGKFAELTREIIDDDVVFENEEVFDIAQDYATVYSRLAKGNRDWGVQGLKVKSTSATTAQLDFPYWGDMWYSVRMIQEGEQWVTGEFTDPYQGELGQYLLLVQFHDAYPSRKFIEQYPFSTDHKLRIPGLGNKHKMTMRIKSNADHGYDVYIGSDEPFWVEEQSSVRLYRVIGTVSVELHFGEHSKTKRLHKINPEQVERISVWGNTARWQMTDADVDKFIQLYNASAYSGNGTGEGGTPAFGAEVNFTDGSVLRVNDFQALGRDFEATLFDATGKRAAWFYINNQALLEYLCKIAEPAYP